MKPRVPFHDQFVIIVESLDAVRLERDSKLRRMSFKCLPEHIDRRCHFFWTSVYIVCVRTRSGSDGIDQATLTSRSGRIHHPTRAARVGTRSAPVLKLPAKIT